MFSIGDVATIPDDDDGTLPQLGSVAKQSGQAIASIINRILKHEDPKSFEYLDMGQMVMVGQHAAAVEIGKEHRQVEGQPAWAMWLGLHLFLLHGRSERMGTFASWAWDTMHHSSRYFDDSDTNAS